MNIKPGRYTVLALILAPVIAWFLPWFLPWFLWVPLAIGLGLVAGRGGYLYDMHCRKVTSSTEGRSPKGLLSPEEFAKVCESYATPTVDPEPELPTPIPPALRDPAFRAREEARAQVRRIGSEARDALQSPYSSVSMYHMMEMEREARRKFDKLEARPLVAERDFEPLTHCSAGHVGVHWIGKTSTIHVNSDPARRCVERTCRYARCGATWWEGA